MRVAFLTHEPFYPPSGGGSAEAVYLVEEFVRRGHEVHLFCPAFAEAEAVAARFGVRAHLFGLWAMGRYAPLRNAKYLAYPFFLERMVLRAARRTPFELIFSQHAIAAVTAGRLRQRLQRPVVMNFLDYLTGFMEAWPAYLAPPPLLRRLKAFELSLPSRYQADAILTVSDTLADYFRGSGYPSERIVPIYYGYDHQLFPLSERSGAGEADGRPVIVMHGSFDHHHLGPIVRAAVLRVAEAKPGARFRFVGRQTAALARLLADLRRAKPNVNLETTGFIPYPELAQHLVDASVGMVPYEETTGTHCAFVAKIVEYLGTGLPVVSTPLNSATRYFKDEPLIYFSAFTGADFGAKILAWLAVSREERRRLGPAASARVARELDWRVICRRAVDVAEKIGIAFDR